MSKPAAEQINNVLWNMFLCQNSEIVVKYFSTFYKRIIIMRILKNLMLLSVLLKLAIFTLFFNLIL